MEGLNSRGVWAGRLFGAGVALAGGVVTTLVGANLWLRMLAAGRLFDVADAPVVPVVIVPGAKIGPDGAPMAYLRGRLDVAIELLAAGKAREILISGDARGNSGDEIASMRRYLVDRGVDPADIRADGEGVSTRATCDRAWSVYSIDLAAVVTQRQHRVRAVALGRAAGIDVVGVAAYCDCRRRTLVRNTIREWFAGPKAVAGLIRRGGFPGSGRRPGGR
ncbi:vancomycin high temperature exclusion protein [Nocardia sp. NPDC020380]|uniref:vancomycin high temperature exclusion protein n=1 Tax=Nocardia sp. NPDC020380 TaxID=3364309 RepID=UPI00379FEB76